MNPPNALHAPLSESELAAVVKAAFGAQATIAQAQPAAGGLFNTSYIIDTLQPAQKVVLRAAPLNQAVLVDFEKLMMSAEPVIYQRMRDAGAPVPQVLFMDATRRIIPRDYLFMEFAEGTPMHLAGVPDSARPSLLRDLGRFTRLIHAVHGDRFGWPQADGTIRGDARWDLMLWGYIEELLTLNLAAQSIQAAQAQRIRAAWQAHATIFQADIQPTLVHNDLWEPNILVRQDTDGAWRISALIDGDRALYADPEFEFVLWSNDPNVMAGYGKPLDMSLAGVMRRRWYFFCTTLMHLHVYQTEYCEPPNAARMAERVASLLAEIEQSPIA